MSPDADSALDLITLQKTPKEKSTASTYTDYHAALSKSRSWRIESTHLPILPSNDSIAIDNNLLTRLPNNTKGIPSLSNPPEEPWVQYWAPHLPPISMISSTTL